MTASFLSVTDCFASLPDSFVSSFKWFNETFTRVNIQMKGFNTAFRWCVLAILMHSLFYESVDLNERATIRKKIYREADSSDIDTTFLHAWLCFSAFLFSMVLALQLVYQTLKCQQPIRNLCFK